MTWQCPRCMVTFREEDVSKYKTEIARCEVPRCNVRYRDRLQSQRTMAKQLAGKVPMILVGFGPQDETAMQEYRRKYEKDFPDAS